MTRFYGTVQGQRGQVTRLGHQSLGVSAQSYSGDVCIEMYRGEKDEDMIHIFARQHDHTGHVYIYTGLVSDLLKYNKDALVLQYAQEALAKERRDAAEALPSR